MPHCSPRIPAAVSLAVGLVVGAVLAVAPRPTLRANGGDRWGGSHLTTGPVRVERHEGLKVQVAQDAVYYLDYETGRLLATVPSLRQSVGSSKMLDTFAERDLAADFKIDPDTGPQPHFLMTTGALGTYGEGWAPLFVFESHTSQVAIYRIQQQFVGTTSRPKFDLMEVRSFAPGASAASKRRRWCDSHLTTGPVRVERHEGLNVQIAQDAVYYLDTTGRLLATVPSLRQSVGSSKMLDTFAERDLAADFKIDPDTGPQPHFLMTTGGALGTYGEGWGALFVFESHTSQVAIYRIQQQFVGTTSRPKFDLMEVRSFAPGASAASKR